VFERWRLQGYALLNILMEIYTERFDPSPGWFLYMPLKVLRREARFHRMPDMMRILKWVSQWPYQASIVQGKVQDKVQGKVQTDFSQKIDRSLPESELKVHRNLPEVCLNDDRWLIELTKTHISLYIPNFLESLDRYTAMKVRQLEEEWPGASHNVAARSDLKGDNRKEDSRNGSKNKTAADQRGIQKKPATDQLLDLCAMIGQLSAANGKSLKASMFVGLAVKEGCHPDAIIETLTAIIRRWKTLDKPAGYWHTTLEDRKKAHGSFDWSAYPVEKKVWSSVATAAKEGG
jgi:hypothetical protein